MSTMASQITSVSIVYSNVCSGPDQRKHRSSASLAFVRRIHRWPVNSPHKGPVTRKLLPFAYIVMSFQSRVMKCVDYWKKNHFTKMIWRSLVYGFVKSFWILIKWSYIKKYTLRTLQPRLVNLLLFTSMKEAVVLFLWTNVILCYFLLHPSETKCSKGVATVFGCYNRGSIEFWQHIGACFFKSCKLIKCLGLHCWISLTG